MTTLQVAKQETEEWAIAAKLITKLIFFRKSEGSPLMLLNLVFCDIDGQQFEIKLWSSRNNDRRSKIFTVYRKVHEDESYIVKSTRPGQQFRPTNPKYSTSKLEFSGAWWIEPIDDLSVNRSIDCSTNIHTSVKAMHQRPVNVLGSYINHKKGPIKNVVRGEPTIQGYFVTLSDDEGRQFAALVWHAIRIDKMKFSLFHCERGDPVLLVSSRLSGASKEMPSITTIQQPVVNSGCVSPRRINALKDKHKATR